MRSRNMLRRAGWAVAAMVLSCIPLPWPALAAVGRPGSGDLSLRLAELAKPSVRSAPAHEQAEELGLAATGPGSLLREGNRVLVEVRFERDAMAGVDDLRAVGASVVDVSRRYQTVTVAARPAELQALSEVSGVTIATEVLEPIASASTCPSGAIVSEGDVQLRAGEARSSFEVDGSGSKVGILSDSFDQDATAETDESDDVKSGDLPGSANTCTGQATPVDVIDDFSGPEAADEGRAIAQIVHDLAPGADLSFATAFSGLTAFADNVEDLAVAGADVLVDDVSYFEEPFFQEGPVGVAVSKVTGNGVSYFSAAGNNNLINGGRDIASWEAPQFRDSLGCPTGLIAFSEALEGLGELGLNPAHCMDFEPGPGIDRTFRITVADGETLIVDLQWAEPWEGVGTDIDAFLFDPSGAVAAGSIEDNIFGDQRPYELVAWENETGADASVQLVINRYAGSNPRLKFAMLQNGGGVTSTEYESSVGGDVVGPTIFGHNGAEDASSVGAIRFNTSAAPEPFSSRGPVAHYFGPADGSGPATELPAAKVLSKPDFVATDCGRTTFFVPTATPGVFRFCGTSAAAPHAAAIAALMLEKVPGATPAEIRTALAESAVPVGAFGPCAVGAGRLDAVAAIEQLLTPTPSPGPLCTPPVSSILKIGGGEIVTAPLTESPTHSADESPPAGGVRDATSPRTFFRQRPPRVVGTRSSKAKVMSRFGADEAGVTFVCRIDGAPFRSCPARFVRRFQVGFHVLRVVARDAAGNADRTPAVARFRVKRRRG